MKNLKDRPVQLSLPILLTTFAMVAVSADLTGQSHSAAIPSHESPNHAEFISATGHDESGSSAGFGAGGGIVGTVNDADRGNAVAPAGHAGLRPFSRIALGVGVSPLGIGLEAATNVNRHFNIRGTGNFFNYTDDGITTEGFNVTAKLNMASAGASVDYYPFHKGFRLSPGVLFYNQNKADAIFVAAAGTSFTLNDHTYYSASGANAVNGLGTFGLGNGRAAFTATTGWGNVIPASGRHFSFPFELGVAFIKQPTVALTLSGYVCDAQGQNCVNVATDATAQADLAAQIQKYQNDVNPLKTYPIISFGVAYNFRIR